MTKKPNTEAPEAPRSAVTERLAAAQDKGYAGEDSLERAGGIEALREKYADQVREGGSTTGSEPDYPPGHPGDPTVRRSTGAA